MILLNELLDNFDVSRGEKFAKGDAYDVSSAPPPSDFRLLIDFDA